MRLVIRQAHLETIKAQVVAAYPVEACGLLSGLLQDDAQWVNEIWPAKNLLAHEPGRFEVDPAHRLMVEKVCRANGQRVIGHWHSHPDSRAVPSETDRAQAYEKDLVWLILATTSHMVMEVRAYRAPQGDDEAFAPLSIELGV